MSFTPSRAQPRLNATIAPWLDRRGASVQFAMRPHGGISIGDDRFHLEVTFIRDDTGDCTWFRSRIAGAQRTPPLAATL